MADKKNSNHDVEADWIRELAGILQETGLTEIEIEKNDIRLRVARQGVPIAVAPQIVVPASGGEASETRAHATSGVHAGTVKSPMVGTAYLSPSPGSPNFVKVGDMVSEGQTVMIVEAMKTMNPITAPQAGKIHSILIADAQPVEFDEPLLVIE